MRVGVVLFNLGGPDSLEAVRPFLKNLFSDPAILRVPAPLRMGLSSLISWRRAPVAREIYAKMGGSSPILPQTEAQRDALAARLKQDCPDHLFHIVIAMRYWHPFTEEAARSLRAFNPDHIVLLPLYPQFSTTTTGSSLKAWSEAWTEARGEASAEASAEVRAIGCYPDHPGFVEPMARRIRESLKRLQEATGPSQTIRLLLSAHGLPEKIIAAGDPYQWQVEQTAAALVKALDVQARDAGESGAGSELDPVICYQSRVGPLTWIGPSTESEIRRAGSEGLPVIMVPIAFVSEHSETLVELDIEYRHLAESSGVPRYERVSTVGSDPAFIGALSGMVRSALSSEAPSCLGFLSAGRCPQDRLSCPCTGSRAALLTAEGSPPR